MKTEVEYRPQQNRIRTTSTQLAPLSHFIPAQPESHGPGEEAEPARQGIDKPAWDVILMDPSGRLLESMPGI